MQLEIKELARIPAIPLVLLSATPRCLTNPLGRPLRKTLAENSQTGENWRLPKKQKTEKND